MEEPQLLGSYQTTSHQQPLLTLLGKQSLSSITFAAQQATASEPGQQRTGDKVDGLLAAGGQLGVGHKACELLGRQPAHTLHACMRGIGIAASAARHLQTAV
jgi:hypothetical protein